MAVQTIITSRKHYTQYANSNDYSLNTSTFNTYLRGGVMGSQKVVYEVELTWFDFANYDTNGLRFTVDGNQLSRNIGSWVDEGFSISDVIDLYDFIGAANIFTDRNITNITDSIIFFDGASVATNTYENSILYGGKTDLFALEYSFGLINNDDEPFYQSLLDNSDQTYYADGIGEEVLGVRDTGFVELQVKNNYNKGWDSSNIGRTRVRFDSRPSTYVQKFIIEHEYVINPYNDESLLDENNSFKYVSKFDFRQTIANLNTSKIAEDNLQLGSVGYFDENYDGYNDDFTISDLVYTDVATASTVTELNIKSRTRVEFNVNSASGYFSNGDPFVILHSYFPEFNNYNKSVDNFRNTWDLITCQNTIGAAPIDNNQAYNVEATFNSVNQISVSFEIESTPTFELKLQEGDNYIIACEVGNGLDQTYNVTKTVDRNTYTKDNNITDLIISEDFGFNPYYRFIAPTVDLFTTYKGWIEDEIVSYHRFGVNRNVSKDAEILQGKFRLVAYEDATGETFDLQSETLDLSNQIIAPPGTYNSNAFNIQLIDDNRTRGYRLPLGDEFNLLLFETDDSDATYQYYEWRVGFKMNWQFWIALPGADSIFIDANDTFRGLNNRASNYSLKEGYSIRVIWDFEMQGLDDDGNTGTTNYNFITDQFSVFDFCEQDDDPTTWTWLLELFDEQDNLIGSVTNCDETVNLLEDEYTRLKFTYTPTAPFIITDIVPYWAEIRIAEEQQQGFINDVLSTTKPYLTDNKLIPLEGDTQAKISLVSNEIIVECRVDYTKLTEQRGYKISGRLANQDEPIPVQVFIFQTETDISVEDFDGNFVAGGGENVTWTLKNGTTYVATNNLNIPSGTTLIGDELDGVCQDVEVTFSTNNPNNISKINLGNTVENANVCGDVDLSIFDSLNTINFNESNIDSIVFGSSQNVNIDLITTNLVPNLTSIDYTPLGAFFGGNIQSISCPNLATLIFPASARPIQRLGFGNCNLLTIDLSMLTGLGTTVGAGADIEFNNNILTSILLPPSSNNIRRLNVKSNDLTTLDLSGLSGFNGNLEAPFNNLTSVIFNANTRFGAGSSTTNGCKLSLNNLGYVDFTVITANNDNSQILLNNNNINAINAQQILDDFNGMVSVWNNVTLLLQTQSPALTAGEITALQTSASYLSLTGTYGWTITL